MLFGPDDCQESRQNIVKYISSLSVGVKRSRFLYYVW